MNEEQKKRIGDRRADERELRNWMDKQYRCPQADRSTASYALEFLKTGQANLEQHQKRTQLALLIADFNGYIQRTIDVAKEIKPLEIDKL